MNLSDVFAAVAYKRLVSVDLPDRGSNAHEINGTMALRDFFGGPCRESIEWRLYRDGYEVLTSFGDITFYDARARSSDRTGRSEWRLYYTGDILSAADVGDDLYLVRAKQGQLYGLVFEHDSMWAWAASRLLIGNEPRERMAVLPTSNLASMDLAIARQRLLQDLDLAENIPAAETDLDLVQSAFGESFPSSSEMSEFARRACAIASEDPDHLLAAWITREEELFRALERLVVGRVIAGGFESVDDFVASALSVINRRKARAGLALQNHLAEVFRRCHIRFDAQPRTERRNRPDFVFPGAAEYASPTFPSEQLRMLAAKSTCKERWRQILAEADRIAVKHLCTLDPGVTVEQAREMQQQGVRLVVPADLQRGYRSDALVFAMTVGGFVEEVRSLQRGR